MTHYGTFLTQNACKNEPLALFLTILDRFKSRIFYECKRMKKLALFLTDVKKIICNS
jgi:hypothetical protein